MEMLFPNTSLVKRIVGAISPDRLDGTKGPLGNGGKRQKMCEYVRIAIASQKSVT